MNEFTVRPLVVYLKTCGLVDRWLRTWLSFGVLLSCFFMVAWRHVLLLQGMWYKNKHIPSICWKCKEKSEYHVLSPFLKYPGTLKGMVYVSLKSSYSRLVFGTWSLLENCKELPFAPWISIPGYLLGKKVVHKLGQRSSEILPRLQKPG